jgi:hypothetical protein
MTTVLLAVIAALATVRASAQVEHGNYSDKLITPDLFLHMATVAMLVASRNRPMRSGAGDIKRAAHGYEPTREAAMATFAKCCDGNSRAAPLGARWHARQRMK